MHAEYDSIADALQIDLREVRVDHDDDAGPGVTVAIAGGDVVGVEILSPAGRIEALAAVAERWGLDREALESAARAALASPDRRVTIEVAARSAA